MIWTGGSSRWLCTQRIAKPTSNPIPMPANAAQTKRAAAYVGEKVPVTSAATANCSATSAVASFTRLSPSRITWMRWGTPSRRMIAVAATASGGETIAPSAKAAAQGSAGTMECAIQATASVVASTSPIASRNIGRRFRRKSRHEVNKAAG